MAVTAPKAAPTNTPAAPVAASNTTPPVQPTPDLTTPGDEARPVKSRKRRSGKDSTIFDDGDPVFRIYQVVGANEKYPQGSLLPIEGVGGFASTEAALNGLRKHAELLVGKQVMVLRGIHIVSVEIETNPRVKLDTKPRIPRPAAAPTA